jgi:hypothetical protein
LRRCQPLRYGIFLSMDWDASPDALVLSILSPEWEDEPSRGDQGSVLERGRNFISTSGGSA